MAFQDTTFFKLKQSNLLAWIYFEQKFSKKAIFKSIVYYTYLKNSTTYRLGDLPVLYP